MCRNSFLTSGYPILLHVCPLLSPGVDGFGCLTDVKADLDNDAVRHCHVENRSEQMYYFSSDEESGSKKIIHKHTKMEVVSMNVSACTTLWSCQVAEECSCFIFPCIPSEANKTNRNVISISFCTVFITACASQTYLRKKLILNAKAQMTLKHFQYV